MFYFSGVFKAAGQYSDRKFHKDGLLPCHEAQRAIPAAMTGR
jgi:hypothetical protein